MCNKEMHKSCRICLVHKFVIGNYFCNSCIENFFTFIYFFLFLIPLNNYVKCCMILEFELIEIADLICNITHKACIKFLNNLPLAMKLRFSWMWIIFTIQVHYTARFADGTVFDSSYKRGRPLTMRIGVGKVWNCPSYFTIYSI